MKCLRCGFENPTGFAFCGRCGNRLDADANADRLLSTDVDHLRRYLPAPLAEALQLDLPAPSPHLLEQCLGHLTQLTQSTAAYLPAHLVERLARDPVPGQADGRFLEGTLLFADISGFTAMSERLTRIGREGAEEITAIVNRYLSVMVATLYAHQGQLMKFGGDALLGLFLEPPAGSATRAAQAALHMQAAMAEFAEMHTSQGTFPLRMKVGLHRGRFFAAQLGNTNGMEYALFGADVNATAAVESAARAGQVLLDQSTLSAITRPCRAIPAETPGYFIMEQLQAEVPSASTTATAAPLPSPELSVKGLRQSLRLLDTLTPYLPAGLLSRLVLSTEAMNFEGEHRLVAVLFANVHGLGDLADGLGPGQEHAITAALNHYFVGMAEAIQSFGGVINKIDLYDHGDKLMALFGAPVAHEDDAERAARAALAMQAAIPNLQPQGGAAQSLISNLHQQIGLNFGNVFAGYLGTTRRREYSVIGDEVNLAARLMSVAQPRQIVVSQGLRRKLQALFNFTPRGAVQLKGKSEPASIFTVDSPRSASEVEHERAGLQAPLVGRDVEVERFAHAMQTLRAGRGQIISVIGEAGLGKTRLVDEVLDFTQVMDDVQRAVNRDGHAASIRWVQGRCLSYTESVSYAPFQDAMRQLLDVPLNAGEAETWAGLRKAVTVLAPGDADAHLPYLANFLNLHLDEPQQDRLRYLDSEALQRRTFLALSALLEASARPPAPRLVVVLEDIHWIDQASRVLLEYLLSSVNRVPLAWLLIYRPERTKACWQVREKIAREFAAFATEIELGPLDVDQTEDLLNHLVPVSEWPPEIHQLILRQTEGNPLYLEELLRVLIESGALQLRLDGRWQVEGSLDDQRLQVPDTLEGVMMTRLDRLDEPSRNTAQVAAVIGRSFTSDVLAHVKDEREENELLPRLLSLQQHEIAEETQRAPERVFTFKHGLMQEVAYGSLLGRVRRQVHRQIAAYLEKRSSRADEGLYPVIARHAFLGQDWPRALRYQTLAGQQAQRLFANSEAIDHFSKALQSAEALPLEETWRERLHIQLALGELLTITAKYDRAAEHLTQALALANGTHDQRGDTREAKARACRWQARLSELRGDYPSAFNWIDQGLRVLEGRETAEAAELTLIGGLIHIRQGNYDRATRQGQAALAMAEALGDPRVLARANNLLGITYLRNNPSAAVEHFQRALALYQRAGDLQGQATANNLIANAQFNLGQWPAAADSYQRARTSFEQLGDVYRSAVALSNLAGLARNQGQLDDALKFYTEARQSLEKIAASPAIRGIVEMNLGATHLRRREAEAALQHLHAAQALFAQTKSRDFLPELRRHLAHIALITGDLAQAETEAGEALALARELNNRGEEGSALRVQGEVALKRGDASAAGTTLEASVAILTEVADEYELARSRFSLARALQALGQRTEARAQLDQAVQVFERLEAALDMRGARRLLAELAEAPPRSSGA